MLGVAVIVWGSVFLLAILASTIAGIVAFRTSSLRVAIIAESLSRLLAVMAFMLFVLVVGAMIEGVFIGFGYQVPRSTVLVLDCLWWGFWPNLMVFSALTLAVVADGILFAHFRSDPETQWQSRVCSLLITLTLTAMFAIGITAWLIPLRRLMMDIA